MTLDNGGFAGAAGAAIAGGTPDTTGINAGQPTANMPNIEEKPKKHKSRAEQRYAKSAKKGK